MKRRRGVKGRVRAATRWLRRRYHPVANMGDWPVHMPRPRPWKVHHTGRLRW